MGDNVKKLTFSEELLLESAEKRYEAEDYLGALTMLNKRAEMYPPSADASALYADIYAALQLWTNCADAWFRFLDTCNEADFSEGYEGLATAFEALGLPGLAGRYPNGQWEGEEQSVQEPALRLVHSSDDPQEGEDLSEGFEYLKNGQVEEAREAFASVLASSPDHVTAAGLVAMCLLMSGDLAGAQAECESLLCEHPDDLHALTTYCAVLTAQEKKKEAREIGKRLSKLKVESPVELFRLITALCEVGLDEEAYAQLNRLKGMEPYADEVLWFHAVAAYRTDRLEEAISSLETYTTLFPRKAVAGYYLVRMREQRDGGEKPMKLSYFYRLPKQEHQTVRAFLSAAKNARGEKAEELGRLASFPEYVRYAFDHLDGRDTELQELAAFAAVNCHCDSAVRELLLTYEYPDELKLRVLTELVIRNEEDSFGVVICGIYREFFIHKIELGARKRKPFMQAYADVYSKFAILSEENENKIIDAAEDVYRTLAAAGMLELAEEREALAVAIFRESRISQFHQSMEAACAIFNADPVTVRELLNYIV